MLVKRLVVNLFLYNQTSVPLISQNYYFLLYIIFIFKLPFGIYIASAGIPSASTFQNKAIKIILDIFFSNVAQNASKCSERE